MQCIGCMHYVSMPLTFNAQIDWPSSISSVDVCISEERWLFSSLCGRYFLVPSRVLAFLAAAAIEWGTISSYGAPFVTNILQIWHAATFGDRERRNHPAPCVLLSVQCTVSPDRVGDITMHHSDAPKKGDQLTLQGKTAGRSDHPVTITSSCPSWSGVAGTSLWKGSICMADNSSNRGTWVLLP